jgi:hypothetical protein
MTVSYMPLLHSTISMYVKKPCEFSQATEAIAVKRGARVLQLSSNLFESHPSRFKREGLDDFGSVRKFNLIHD